VPERQWVYLRGEDVLAWPEPHFVRIASWLGVRTDPLAITSMFHPEESTFARPGPRGAELGNDPHLLLDPTLRAGESKTPKDARRSGIALSRPGAHVVELARLLGYDLEAEVSAA